MKRTILALLLLTAATPLLAVKGTPDGKRTMRVAVLHTNDRWADESYNSAASAIEHEIAAQLRAKGYDAWEAHRTLDDVRDGQADAADLYVEVSGGDARLHEIGGLDVSGPHLATTLGLIVSKCAAEIRVYDGQYLDLINRFELSHRKTALVPTSLGLREGPIYAITVVPIMRHLQYRSVIHDTAEEAVSRIIGK